jgi:hypothetical protein
MHLFKRLAEYSFFHSSQNFRLATKVYVKGITKYLAAVILSDLKQL